MMRVGIDVKALRKNNSGIARYLRNLIFALESLDEENEYVLFSPEPIFIEFNNPNFKTVFESGKIKLPGILWQQWTLPRLCKQERVDILWGPEQTIPILPFLLKTSEKKTKTLLTLHDFVYRRYPETMQKSVLWITRIFGTLSIFSADWIICVSKWTARELLHFHPKAFSKSSVIPCGIFWKKETNEIVSKKNGRLLFVGSLEPRKNLLSLLIALEILHDEGLDIPLDIVGPPGWKNESIHERFQKSPIRKNVFFLGFVDEKTLHSLYKSCEAFVFPSLYEGFGLPALEALSFGARVLTSKNSPMEEAMPSLAFSFDPKNPREIAETIKKVFEEKWKKENALEDSERSGDFLKRREEVLLENAVKNSANLLISLFKTLEEK